MSVGGMAPTPQGPYDRAPTSDERAGMSWWNNLSEAERAAWLMRAALKGGSSVADAWSAFKGAAADRGERDCAPRRPIGRPPKEVPADRVGIRLDPEVRRALEGRAAAAGLRLATYLQRELSKMARRRG